MVIAYNKSLKVTNIECLPGGTGAKYLVTIRGQDDVLIAKAWARKLPKNIGPNEVVISF